jgi:hypothetical protein
LLYNEEDYAIKMRYPNFNLFFQSDMDYETDGITAGRRFGGRCWLVKRTLNVISFDFDNPDYSVLRISIGCETLNIIGAWIPFENNKLERFLNFKSIKY